MVVAKKAKKAKAAKKVAKKAPAPAKAPPRRSFA
jgi:hypothetical protein